MQFAIEFAQADDVSDTATASAVRQFVVSRHSPAVDFAPQSVETLKALQKTTRELLVTLVERGYVIAERNVKTLLVRAGRPSRPLAGYVPARKDEVLDVSLIPDRFLNRVIRLFEEVGLDKLQVCQALQPGRDDAICGRLFLKVTRKEFCSTRCQSRTYMRGYSQTASEATRKRGSRHGNTTRTRRR